GVSRLGAQGRRTVLSWELVSDGCAHGAQLGCRSDNRSMANEVINVILKLGTPHLELLDFLIRGEIDVFFDAIDLIVKPVIFIEDSPEMIVGAFKPADHLAVLGEFSQDRMMKVHWNNLRFRFVNLVCLNKRRRRMEGDLVERRGGELN